MLSGDVVRRTLDGNSVVYLNSNPAAKAQGLVQDSVVQIHVASFPANAPIEDAFAINRVSFATPTKSCSDELIVETSDTEKKDAELKKPFNLFTVVDGHWAPHCGAALAQILPVFIQDTINDPNPSFYTPVSAAPSITPVSKSGSELPSKLSSAFIHCDASLLSYPFSLLPDNFFDLTNDQVKLFFDNNKELKDQVSSALLPAVTGACALSALVRDDELVLANTGDCRAVLGTEGDNGVIRAVELTRDHNGANASEVSRLQSEHPASEKDTVIFVNRGDTSRTKRVLGGLMPTRSFGDAKYKWPVDVSDKVDVIDPRIKKAIPMQKDCKTPPYITAAPEISEHKLSSKDRFFVLATDGLYDQLSSNEVVDVVSSLLATRTSKDALVFPPWISAQDSAKLPSHLKPTSVNTLVDSSGKLLEASSAAHVAGGVNLATSLVRAALVGGDHGRLKRTNSAGRMTVLEEAELRAGLEPGEARSIRDDITCIVVVLKGSA
ncbi:hypothetical protein HDU78_001005 [Chytriomyces hyalinus]|nr:hypothetical protein HDU78_001005 [Chytriomyces hyalinus]